jgi:YidC/Oxa1 family membrane protein insertase
MLLQIPVFYSLYKVLFVTIEMRHAPFYGWIQDLSAPDPTSWINLFGLLPFNPHTTVPAFLIPISIGVWPIFYGLTMWLQQKLNPAPTDPMQAKMFAFMPLIFTFLFGSFPAGLVIYYTWSNMLNMLQQYIIMRREGVKVHLFENLKLKKRATDGG